MTAADDPAGTLVVRRLIRVPRELVFAAWLDPASLAQWMCPGSVTGATVEVDPRVGGAFRIVMHGHRDGEHWGEYLIIEPPSLLSFNWISVNTDRKPTLVTVEFHEREAGTEVILTQRLLPPAKLDAHEKGWADILRKLEGHLAG
jgi:uncharacterized protein YndB with AHSA1/START domain